MAGGRTTAPGPETLQALQAPLTGCMVDGSVIQLLLQINRSRKYDWTPLSTVASTPAPVTVTPPRVRTAWGLGLAVTRVRFEGGSVRRLRRESAGRLMIFNSATKPLVLCPRPANLPGVLGRTPTPIPRAVAAEICACLGDLIHGFQRRPSLTRSTASFQRDWRRTCIKSTDRRRRAAVCPGVCPVVEVS
jgi:hypothetical protein